MNVNILHKHTVLHSILTQKFVVEGGIARIRNLDELACLKYKLSIVVFLQALVVVGKERYNYVEELVPDLVY
jgi:hypothetical protein